MLVFSVGPAAAQWIKVSNSGNAADDFVGYVDAAGIVREGDVAKMSDLRNYRQAQDMKPVGKVYWSKQVRAEYHCKDRQMRWVGLTYYAATMAKGDIVHTDEQSRKWILISPGSVGETRWKIACAGKTNRRGKAAES